MRKRFETQLKIGQTPIEEVKIPIKSRDEMPPLLAALQWIFITPEINRQVFALLTKKVVGTKQETGRKGMNLWHVFVLGVVRLALDCDYDRLEYLVHYDKLLREIMGLNSFAEGEFGKGFHQKTISENVCHIDEALLVQINEIVVKEGRSLFTKKKNEKIQAKTDTYVVESNVHFPTDLNLLWDAARKCIRMLSELSEKQGIPGWRKRKNWETQIKSLMRICGQTQRSGGVNKEERLKKGATQYIEKSYELENKIHKSITTLQAAPLTACEYAQLEHISYFHDMLIKHIDLIDRRLLKGERIPHHEKVFSIFEPHTHWINKGKPNIELGRKLLLTTDQYGLILHHKIMDQLADSAETVPLVADLLFRYKENGFDSISFDKGFSVSKDLELLELFIPTVVMPKKGRLNQEDKAREGHKKFKRLKQKHSAIESNINCLEHHGLNRCPDKGEHGFKRYAALGVLAYNCHKIGNQLIAFEKQKLLKKAA